MAELDDNNDYLRFLRNGLRPPTLNPGAPPPVAVPNIPQGSLPPPPTDLAADPTPRREDGTGLIMRGAANSLIPPTLALPQGIAPPTATPPPSGALPNPNDPKYNPAARHGLKADLSEVGLYFAGGAGMEGLNAASAYKNAPRLQAQAAYQRDLTSANDAISNEQKQSEAAKNNATADQTIAEGALVDIPITNEDGTTSTVQVPQKHAATVLAATQRASNRPEEHVTPGEMVKQPDGTWKQVGTPKPTNDDHVASGDMVKQPDGTWKQIGTPKSSAAEAGTWSIQEDKDGNPIEYNSKSGQTRAAPQGVMPRGSKAKADAAKDKVDAPVQAAIEYGSDYLKRGVFTGAGDEALQEKFFDLAKPATGFRMSQPQMNMLQNSRDWMSGLEAKARHATKGTWFSDDQRKQIVDTMKELSDAKLHSTGGGGQTVIEYDAQGNRKGK